MMEEPTAEEIHDISERFRYHPPTGEQTVLYERVRRGAYDFADIILRCVPPGSERVNVLDTIEDAMNRANRTIARRCGYEKTDTAPPRT